MVKKVIYQHGGSSSIWFFGFIGALIYEVQHAVGAGDLIIGIFKSIVWPAFVTFRVFEFFRI